MPDYYTYVGNSEILNWIGETYRAAGAPLSKFNHIDDDEIHIRCKDEEDCPRGNFCFERFCYERSTKSASKQSMRPNPTCPKSRPCKGRREEECREAKCNRYGDSCWCEARRRTGRQALDVVQREEPGEFDFVEGEPQEWEIPCSNGDDCPHLWYCFEKVFHWFLFSSF